MKSIATSYLKMMKQALSKRLAPLGFSLQGNTLSKDCNGVQILVEIQRDAKHGTKDELRFTLNVGLLSRALQDFENADQDSGYSIPASDRWHWNSRMGNLLPERRDRWWVVAAADAVEPLIDELFKLLVAHVLPKLEPLAQDDQLLALWRSGGGSGLTEYRRRRSLAALLFALGRFVDAKVAINELSTASLGKSWEGAARYDVKVLSERLEKVL